MIACPWCHHSHPNLLTASQCTRCGQSIETVYLCTNRKCSMHITFQAAARDCQVCERTLTGEFSGRSITWGNSVYRVREYLGGGGMGEVYRGIEHDQAGMFSREVAIKFNKNMMDADVVERFKLEVQVLNLLQNPHNIRVYNYGELYEERHTGLEVRSQFMVMELLKGEPLNEIIQNGGMPATEAASLFAEVCSALSEAHQKGVIHRDIKPHNIMLQDVSGTRFAKVFDFGLARQTNSMDARLSTSGVVMGTFRYMSPEQALGEDLDHRTDVFSLGVVLYELLSTRHPFPGKNLFELFTLHQSGPPPLPEVPEGLAAIVMKSLAYEKDQRFASCDELRNSLQFWLGESLSGRGMLSPLYKNEGDLLIRSPETMHSQQNAVASSSQLRGLVNATPASHDSLSRHQSAPSAPSVTVPSGSKSNTLLMAGIGVLVVAILAVGGLLLMTENTKQPNRVIAKKDQTFKKAHVAKQNIRPAFRENSSGIQVVGSYQRTPPTSPKARTVQNVRTSVKEPRATRKTTVRRYRKRRRYRRRTYRRAAPIVRRVARPIPIPQPVFRPAPRRVIPIPRPIIVRKAPVPVVRIKRRVPALARCPSQSGWITYRQLDRSLGRSLTTKTSRLLNKAASSSVYDSGLRLSQSWKLSPVLCKKNYLCQRMVRLFYRVCSRYKPHSHCTGYRPAKIYSGGRTRFVCRR